MVKAISLAPGGDPTIDFKVTDPYHQIEEERYMVNSE
jgi:hypothetical protein